MAVPSLPWGEKLGAGAMVSHSLQRILHAAAIMAFLKPWSPKLLFASLLGNMLKLGPNFKFMIWDNLYPTPAYNLFSLFPHIPSMQAAPLLFMECDLCRFCPQIHSSSHLVSSGTGKKSSHEATTFHFLPSHPQLSQFLSIPPTPQNDREAVPIISLKDISDLRSLLVLLFTSISHKEISFFNFVFIDLREREEGRDRESE